MFAYSSPHGSVIIAGAAPLGATAAAALTSAENPGRLLDRAAFSAKQTDAPPPARFARVEAVCRTPGYRRASDHEIGAALRDSVPDRPSLVRGIAVK